MLELSLASLDSISFLRQATSFCSSRICTSKGPSFPIPDKGEILGIVVPFTGVVFFNLLSENGFSEIALRDEGTFGDDGDNEDDWLSLPGLFSVGEVGFRPNTGNVLLPFTLISLNGDSIGPSPFASQFVTSSLSSVESIVIFSVFIKVFSIFVDCY